jgi:hypothetical protein
VGICEAGYFEAKRWGYVKLDVASKRAFAALVNGLNKEVASCSGFLSMLINIIVREAPRMSTRSEVSFEVARHRKMVGDNELVQMTGAVLLRL